jgi:15-cis-phytoene synthase
MQDTYRHCEALVREADRDRFIASLFAPAGRRPHLYALHAFDLELLRVGHLVHEALAGEMRLQWWRDALAGGVPDQVAAHPVAAALTDTIARCALPIGPIEQLIDARAHDLYDDPFATLDELEGYARQTASATFALAARILDRDANVDDVAEPAGIAAVLIAALQDPVRYKALSIAPADIAARGRAALDQARHNWPAVSPAAQPAFLSLAVTSASLRRAGQNLERLPPKALAPWRRQWLIWRAARRGTF